MNKRDKAQLRASIANDLVQGHGEHSPTRELLRQYAPLEGIITTPAAPVENSVAPSATVARTQRPGWHDATEASAATASHTALERFAAVKGELRVPNTINFSVFPTLNPFARAVYYQLFLLSHGFRRDTCIVGLAKLARSVLMSQRKVQDTVAYLEKRGLIRRVGSILGGPSKGNVYQVPISSSEAPTGSPELENSDGTHDPCTAPRPTLASRTTMAPHATNKDDDDLKRKSSSKGKVIDADIKPVQNHSCAALPQERQDAAAHDFVVVRAAYEKATGNRWTTYDSDAFTENNIGRVPVTIILSVLESVPRRTPARTAGIEQVFGSTRALVGLGQPSFDGCCDI